MAILADAAYVANGKFFIHGGGWDSIFAMSFPASHPSMALAMMFELTYEEAHDPQPYRIDLVNEDDEPMPVAFESQVAVGIAPGQKKTSVRVPAQLTIPTLQFPAPGEYRFRIWSKEAPLAEVPLNLVRLAMPVTMPPSPV